MCSNIDPTNGIWRKTFTFKAIGTEPLVRNTQYLTGFRRCAILMVRLRKTIQKPSRGACRIMRSWYLVTVKPSRQDAVEDGLGSQRFQVYNPKYVVEGEKREPVFPGYIFVNVDIELQSVSKINNTRGVRKLVTFGDVAVAIPNVVVERMIDRFGGVTPMAPKPSPFKVGQKLQVVHGPMAGLEAIFDEQDGEKRSIILLTILGSMQRFSFNNKHLQAV